MDTDDCSRRSNQISSPRPLPPPTGDRDALSMEIVSEHMPWTCNVREE